MSEIKLFSVLLVLIFISCALSVGEFEDDSPGSGSEVSSNGSTELSSSSRTGALSSSTESTTSSSSIEGTSSGSVINTSSSSVTGVSSSSRTSNSSSSKKEDLSSSSEDLPKYGDNFTDSRNSKTYKTVIIGTQTWMESNLNYKPGSPSGITKCYAEGYGYDEWLKPDSDAAEIESNCEKYGRLYDWVTAMALPATCATTSCGSQVTGKHQGVCPSGWHIPSRDEWIVLRDYIGKIIFDNYEDEDFGWGVGTKLKATSGWKDYPEQGNGLDTYGFNAVGSGYCYNCTSTGLNDASGRYSGKEEITHWWSATEYVNQYTKEAKNAYRFTVNYNSNGFIEKNEYRSDLYSVRCVKN